MKANPFKPTAGKMPPILIGRQNVIDDFKTGLKNGAGAPERLMLITGQRGFGKTVMLSELEKIASDNGWETYHETASEGMIARLLDKLKNKKASIGKASISPSVSIPGIASLELGGVELSMAERTVAMRDLVNARLKRLPEGKGIMFAIDEAQAASMDDLIALATTVQHVIHDEDMTGAPDDKQHGVAFVFAALPNLVDDLVNDKVLTFLRRSTFERLSAISASDVRNAYMKTISGSGKKISIDDAQAAAQATGGNPFLVQLIGYCSWEFADARGSNSILAEDIEQGTKDAVRRYYDTVCAPAFNSLTSAQQKFAAAMAIDYPDPSHLDDIAKHAGKSISWARKYRASLINAQVIEPVHPGFVRYTIPYFGDWAKASLHE